MKKKNDQNLLFGKRLKTLREAARLTASDVANEVGVAVSTYREWEQGRAVTGQPYQLLAKALRISVYDLLGLEEVDKAMISEQLLEAERILQGVRKSL